MNEIIKCLAHTPQIVEFALSYEFHSFLTSKASEHNLTHNLSETLIELIQTINNNTGSLKPIMFHAVFTELYPKFKKKEQRDAAEFLMLLFQTVDSETKNLTIIQQDPVVHLPNEIEHYNRYMKKNRSMITSLFSGMTLNTMTCNQCTFQNSVPEAFNILELMIPSDIKQLKEVNASNY